jgi:hypothetical protein
MKNVFSLYALGWENIDNRNGQLLGKPEPRDPPIISYPNNHLRQRLGPSTS